MLDRLDADVGGERDRDGAGPPFGGAPLGVPLGVPASVLALPAAQPGLGEFLQIVRLAARLGRAPLALLCWPGAFGPGAPGEGVPGWSDPALGLSAAHLEQVHALCLHLGGAPAAAVVADAREDPRLWHEEAVTGVPGVRFVASVPLLGRDGEALGALCVADTRPRARLQDESADALAELAALAARLLERQQDGEAQARAVREQARLEAIEALVTRAASCEAALTAVLGVLCRQHGAPAGFVARLGTSSRVMKTLGHHKDGSVLGDELVRLASAGLVPEMSPVASAIVSLVPRVLRFTDPLLAPMALAGAVQRGLRAQVVQPLGVLDERYGLVLLFGPGAQDGDEDGLDAVAADLAMVGRALRPALFRKVAEQRLSLLGKALDRANDTVVILEAGPLGLAGPRIVYANESFCQSMGHALEDVLGEPHGMLHGPDTDMGAVARLRAEMRAVKPARTELLAYRRDGTSFWAELDFTPIRDGAGALSHWACIGRDVTERRRTVERQRQHETSFRMLFQDNPVPMVVVARGGDVILEANAAALEQYGWARAELIGRRVSSLSPDGEAFEAEATLSVTHVRRDGTVLEVRSMAHHTVYDGQDATVVVLWDVTEHEATRRDMRHALDMLRDRDKQFAARTEELAEAQRLAKLGTWCITVDNGVVTWSREMYELMEPGRSFEGRTFEGRPHEGRGLEGHGEEGRDGEAPLQHVHPEDREAVQAALLAAAGGGGRQGFEYRVVLADGEVRFLRAEVRPVEDDSGQVVQLFGCSQDISERKRTELVLLRNESLRALGQLTGGVAHDFNNLLTVVILNLEEAQDVLEPDHELQEVLAPALHAAVRGADLTSQLLAYSRRATLRPERVRPEEFFGALRPLLSRVLGERFELQVLLRHNGGSVMIDPAQLDSAIMNLVINARDAMAAGGTIVLETRSVALTAESAGFADEVAPGRYVVISVADKGQGIPPELLGRVFEPFFTTKEAGKGSGLGLSMVYGFARQSGGHVTIESRKGEGTVVRLFLPVADAEAAPAPALEGPVDQGWAANGMRVLLVEDQDAVLRTVGRMLRALGFKVTEASSTDEALEELDCSEPFDLLFTDIVLPGPVDGLGLAEEVQARAPSTRILLTSGFTEHGLSAEEVGGVDFLMKPYKRHDLEAKFTGMFPRPPMPERAGGRAGRRPVS